MKNVKCFQTTPGKPLVPAPFVISQSPGRALSSIQSLTKLPPDPKTAFPIPSPPQSPCTVRPASQMVTAPTKPSVMSNVYKKAWPTSPDLCFDFKSNLKPDTQLTTEESYHSYVSKEHSDIVRLTMTELSDALLRLRTKAEDENLHVEVRDSGVEVTQDQEQQATGSTCNTGTSCENSSETESSFVSDNIERDSSYSHSQSVGSTIRTENHSASSDDVTTEEVEEMP